MFFQIKDFWDKIEIRNSSNIQCYGFHVWGHEGDVLQNLNLKFKLIIIKLKNDEICRTCLTKRW